MRVYVMAVLLAGSLLMSGLALADEVELLNGQRIRGSVVEESKDSITFNVTMGGAETKMRFPVSRVHAVTIGGRRIVLNEKPGAESKAATKAQPPEHGEAPDDEETPQAAKTPVASDPEPEAKSEPSPKAGARSQAEVAALIRKAGATPPDWYEATPLDYPQSLDLSWPEKPQGPWNPSKNIGQYLWSTINENPSRWKSGIRFLHHLLTVHKDNPPVLTRTMEALANSYFNLMQDWARAAFWWEKVAARQKLSVFNTVRLAECYWRLGSKAMAVAKMREVDGYVSAGIVKLWSEMGEPEKALRLAAAMARPDERGDQSWVAEGHLAAGDVYRLHGRYSEAVARYQKVLEIQPIGQRKGQIERLRNRAQANIDAIKVYDALDLKRIPDGAYRATSISYAGPLEVTVTVAAGRIESVRVSRFEDKQYYSSLVAVPEQIVAKQSVKGIDAVTCATITSEAIVNATAKALAGAMK